MKSRRSLWRRLVHYRLRVPIDVGNGPTVVLLHGIANKADYWDKTVKHLRKKHRVIAVDLLGFGISPKPLDIEYSATDQARALCRTLLWHGVRGPIIIIGFSLGSLVAIEFATRYPHKVSKLVLVSMPIYLKPTQFNRDILNRWQSMLSGRLNAAYFKFYRLVAERQKMTQRFLASHKRLLPAMNSMEVADENWYGFAMSLKNAIEKQRAIKQLGNLTCPVELFYGRYDPVIIRANLTQVRRAVPSARLHILSSGHDLPLKFPDKIAHACLK